MKRLRFIAQVYASGKRERKIEVGQVRNHPFGEKNSYGQ
jgi:hypothetical protein